MKRMGLFIIGALLVLSVVPMGVAKGAAACTLCILEVQVMGINGEEDQDFVVVANVTDSPVSASTTNPIQLRYYNAQGILAQTIFSVTTSAGMAAHEVRTYAASSLLEIGQSAAKTLPVPLYSGGGMLELTGGKTGVGDRLGWGNGSPAELLPFPAPLPGVTLARKQVDGIRRDTDNNSLDFQGFMPGCRPVQLSEMQPFVIDEQGQSREAWIELQGLSSERGDCLLVTQAGDLYTIPSTDMPVLGEAALIAHGYDTANQLMPLHLGEVSGKVWLAAASMYGGLKLPVATLTYSNLQNGQSWALVDGIWRKTFSPTPGGPNVFQAAATLFDDDPTACEAVRISELLPNPPGEDTGNEWIEVTNTSNVAVPLTHCQISIGGTIYNFLPEDILGPAEWRVDYDLYDSDQNQKSVSLRNSGEVTVLLQRLRSNGLAETIQSFIYTDAPEGQSWARFDNGWRWLEVPNPLADNSTPPPPLANTDPTEFPVAPGPESSEGQQPSVTSSPVRITELLPNPATPATDEADEFVELYNDSDEAVHLMGYTLQVGNTYSYSVTFGQEVIASRSYLVLTSGATTLSLANSGGAARLLDPAGIVVSEAAPYVDALSGYAWAYRDGLWQWTTSPTPGTDNIIHAPLLTGLSKAGAASQKKTTGNTKSAITSKTSAAKAPKSTTASAKPANDTKDEASVIPSVHPLVLAGVGGAALLYAAYEYRQDIRNQIYQFKRNRDYRRANRAAAQRRGTD